MKTENLNNISSGSFDEIRAILRDIAERQALSSIEFDRRSAEFDRRSAEFESRSAEFERWRQESNAEFERRRQESNAEFERLRQESNADFDRRIKKLEDSIGSMNNNIGRVTEYFFYTSFDQGKRNFFGEEFYEIRKNVGGLKIAAEYDFILINGQSVAIIEVKYKAHENDISKVLKKVVTFRANFPEYQNHKIYLGLASMAFYPELEQACIDNGIAIVKQVGDTIVLNYDNLRAY